VTYFETQSPAPALRHPYPPHPSGPPPPPPAPHALERLPPALFPSIVPYPVWPSPDGFPSVAGSMCLYARFDLSLEPAPPLTSQHSPGHISPYQDENLHLPNISHPRFIFFSPTFPISSAPSAPTDLCRDCYLSPFFNSLSPGSSFDFEAACRDCPGSPPQSLQHRGPIPIHS